MRRRRDWWISCCRDPQRTGSACRLARENERGLDSREPFRVSAVRFGRRRIILSRTLENVIEGAAITFIEITDRKTMEDCEKRLKRAVQTVRRVNRLIVNEDDPERLIGEACRILAESLEYRSVWAVLTEPNTSTVRSVAASKATAEFANFEAVVGDGRLPSCAARTLDRKQPALVACRSTDCPDCPIPGIPPEYNLLACRMEFANRIYGILIATVPGEQSLDEDEHGYFLELARDFGFALRNMEKASRANLLPGPEG